MFNDEHLAKAFFPITEKELGILILTSDEHSEKAKSPIELLKSNPISVCCCCCSFSLSWFSLFDSKTTQYNVEQDWKQLFPISIEE